MTYELEILPLTEENSQKRKRQIVGNPKGFIVLVHGICHGAWCWENFIDFFATEGYQCYAVSLRGHGKSEGRATLNSFTLSDYVEDVKTVVGKCTTKPFLIGHSMGGAVVQQYIGKYADTVQGAVLFAPATAPRMTLWDVMPKNRNLVFATLIAFGWELMFSKEYITQWAAFFTGTDKNGKKVQRVKNTSDYAELLQPESMKVIRELSKADYSDNYSIDIPVFVIGSYADQYFPQKSLEKTATAYAHNGKTALIILDYLCHDMMLDDYEPEAWKASAEPVLAFIEDPISFASDPKNHWPRK